MQNYHKEKFEKIYKLKKRALLLHLVQAQLTLSDKEEKFLMNPSDDELEIMNAKFFLRQFPNTHFAENEYPGISQKAAHLSSGNTHYYRQHDNLYGGTFDVHFADRLLTLFREKNVLSKVKKGIFYNIFPPFVIGDYRASLLNEKSYTDGLPLYIGETTNTCDVLGKLGSDLAINGLLSDKLQLILIEKKLSDGTFVHLGHMLLLASPEFDKIILSSIESIYIPINICYEILIKVANNIISYFQSSNHTCCLQIGIGGRTLRSLGYYVDNFPVELLSRHLNIVRGISSSDDYDVLMKYIENNKNPYLENFIFTLDKTEIPLSLGNCEVHEDARRYRINLLKYGKHTA